MKLKKLVNNFINHVKFEPRYLPFWKFVSYPFAFFMRSRYLLIDYTSKIKITHLSDYSGPAIYINWHQHLPYLCHHHGIYKRWLLSLNVPYMETIVRWCQWSGLNIVRGGSGGNKEENKQAMSFLITQLINHNQSVFLAVDGPNGPIYKIKDGCIYIALKTKLPIIFVNYTCKHSKPDPSRWDQMWFPRSYMEEIHITYHTPMYINNTKTIDEWKLELERLYAPK